MEFRLFLDEPRLIFKAQRDLLREDLRLFRQIAIPCLIAAPFFTLVIWQADRVYGRAPLPAGEPVVVTAHGDAQLHAPAGLVVETPAVRIQRTHEVSWRVRPTRPFSGTLPGFEIPWPRATVLGVSWLVWFFGISSLSAVLAKRILPLLLIAVCVHYRFRRGKDARHSDLDRHPARRSRNAANPGVRRKRNDLHADRFADPADAAVPHVADDIDVPVSEPCGDERRYRTARRSDAGFGVTRQRLQDRRLHRQHDPQQAVRARSGL